MSPTTYVGLRGRQEAAVSDMSGVLLGIAVAILVTAAAPHWPLWRRALIVLAAIVGLWAFAYVIVDLI